MKIRKAGVGRGAAVTASLLMLFSVRASAQTPSAQSNVAQKSQVQSRVVDTVDDNNRVVMKGNVHPRARAEFDQGAVSDAQPITRMMLLLQRSPQQELQLQQLMEQQQAKGSPNYHAWLTPDQFGAQFGPADADVQAVTSWLTSHGFQNLKVSKGKIAVEFSGNVGQVRNAFGTEIHKFNVNGEEHFANVSDPQIPAALAPVVKGIRSLHNFRAKPQVRNLGSFRRTETGEIRPLFTYTDANGQFFGLGPADFATIYSVPPAITGTGQTIAIVGRSNVNLQDIRDFRTMFGLPANDPNIILNGPDPGLVSGDETEADLDVEWAGAVAPAATIDFVVTESTQTDGTDGIDGSAMYIVDNNIAPILSESFGSCESGLGSGGNAFFNSLWQQAAAQGITVVVAAGDNGSAACDPASATANQDAAASGLAISGIASTPFNTALGGTDFDDVNNQSTFWNTTNTSTTAVVASAKGYIPERTWNDSCAAAGSTSGCTAAIVNANNAAAIANGGPGIDLGAGSGGQSSVYPKPTWQTGFGADTTRDIPDVSLFSSDNGSQTSAANSFYIICESDQDPAGGTGCNLATSATLKTHDFLAVGGTSAATPTFAAIMSLVIQQTGQRQGVANPVLYSLAKTAANVCSSSSAPALPNSCVFYDITKGNNSVACVGGSPNCSNGTAGQFGIMATSSGGTTPAFNAGTGYDLATGLGTVNVTNLIAKWVAPSLTPTSTSLAAVGTVPSTIGASATFTGSITKSSGTANPTGIALLRDSSTGAVIATAPVVASPCTSPAVPPCYTITTTLLPASATAYNVVAHYGGDGTFAGSDSTGVSINIPKQNSQVLVDFLTTNANGVTAQNTVSATVAYGSSYIMRVDVTNTSGTPCQNASFAITFACPAGSIQLFQNPGVALNDFPNAQNANATSMARLNERGFAEDQPIQLTPGAYHISATYTADTNSSFNSSTTSNTVAVTVTQATTTTTLAAPSPASIASGGTVTLSATVNTTSNGAGPTGTVQFKNGSSNLGAAVTCTPTAANTSAAFCTATLTTTLSQFVPLSRPQPRLRIPGAPPWILTFVAILVFALAQHAARLQQRWPSLGRRLGYAGLGLLLFACLAAGFAGCSGGGGGSHTDSITAVYSGDTNYSGSTATAVSVTVQ